MNPYLVVPARTRLYWHLLVALSVLALAAIAWSAFASEASPGISIILGPRHGHATPTLTGDARTGSGNIDILQPASDTLIVTMTGATLAGAHPCKDTAATIHFDLCQDFELAFSDPKLQRARLLMETRLIGLLRSAKPCCRYRDVSGFAEVSSAWASIDAGSTEILSVEVPSHSVAGGEDLSINDHAGPRDVVFVSGKYALHQQLLITALHQRTVLPCGSASAEFAPDPALDPLWLGREPFHGANKKDFGFQVVLRAIPDTL
jgi:hypothetical protein